MRLRPLALTPNQTTAWQTRHLVALAHASDLSRDGMRQRIRTALHPTAERLALEAFGISSLPPLKSKAGQAPAWSGVPLAVSISHDGPLSIAALATTGAVGVDLCPVLELSDTERLQLTQEYLGLDTLPTAEQFAQQWANHEAALKCLHRPLTEWHPALGQQLATIAVQPLLIEGYADVRGALAYCPNSTDF